MKKPLLYLLVSLTFLITGGWALSAQDVTEPEVQYRGSVPSVVFPGSNKLNTVLVTYVSSSDISDFSLQSYCDIESKFVARQANAYIFRIKYLDPNCSDGAIHLKKTGEHDIWSGYASLQIQSDFDLYNRLTDYSNTDLASIRSSLSGKKQKLSLFADYEAQTGTGKYNFYKKKILYHQYDHSLSLIDNILSHRQQKYMVPVVGATLPNEFSKLPNSPRPYRAAYTDGIHHGWDIDGYPGQELVALDAGIILRVVDGFQDTDFDRLQKQHPLSQLTELRNLDILRGNQVWLKTMKGDVVFYSHLQDVSVQTGDIVDRGRVLGTMGVTGVPEVGYDDYHLHFPVHQNPYIRDQAGKYSFDDYMAWDWYFRGKSAGFIRQHQSDLFE